MKTYIYIAAGIFSLSLLVGLSWFSYNSGVNNERAEQAANRDKAVKKDELKVKTVIEYKEKIKVVYRDKIKLIKNSKDATGCADTKLTDMGFRL